MSDGHEDLEIWRAGHRTGVGGIAPAAPAIVLHEPKYPHNVGQIVRLASAYGIAQIWYSGERIREALGARLPREERMRRYEDVALINHPDPLARLCEAVPQACPVAVELRPHSESLVDFIHPQEPTPPIYVFGPEDGSLSGPIVKRCHRFVVIPSYECLTSPLRSPPSSTTGWRRCRPRSGPRYGSAVPFSRRTAAPDSVAGNEGFAMCRTCYT